MQDRSACYVKSTRYLRPTNTVNPLARACELPQVRAILLGMKKFTVELTLDLWQRFKQRLLDDGTNAAVKIREMIEAYLATPSKGGKA